MKYVNISIGGLADRSLPLWERGLKWSLLTVRANRYIVAPLVGAWIEIMRAIIIPDPLSVAPLVGAWIEIRRPGIPGYHYVVAPLMGA